MTETKFKVGDRVKAFGVSGTVEDIHPNSYYPIRVMFDDRGVVCFSRDGKYQDWHLKPSLKLIKFKPKKKGVKYWHVLLKDNGSYFMGSRLFKSIEEAQQYFSIPPSRVVRLLTELPPVIVEE